MLAELMLVKLVVRRALVDPVLTHPCHEVIFAKRLDQAQDAGTLVRWDDGTVGQLIGGVGRWLSIILTAQIAVLGVGTIAKIWPQSMQCPVIGGEQLTLRLETSVCRPELGREEESSVCFGTARVDGVRVGGAGAGQNGVGVGCGGIALASADCCRIVSSYSLN